MTKSPRKSVRHSTTNTISIIKQNFKHVIEISSESEEDNFCVSPPPIEPPRTPKKHKSRTLNNDEAITPPKQRKSNENSPPQTPKTPSTLLKNLILDSPEKVKTSEPKKLFDDHFQNARKALHSIVPSKLPAREKELQELRGFIDGCLDNETSGSLYISGPPGTGKTAALSIILRERQTSILKTVFVNCTAVKSSGAIYARIARELGLKACKTEKDNLGLIEKFLTKNQEMILVILDEIDQLDCKNQTVLYTIFEWPARRNSKIILIGIANALDLTDRILPRLHVRCELKPKLMHFAPYSKQQIIQIFLERLQESNASDVFAPAAIQMLAGKVAAISGDVRRALDIGRRVIELAENHRSTTVLQSTENLIKDVNYNKGVDLKQVLSVLNNVYGTSQNLTDDSEDTFSLQQKVVVCTLLLMLKKAKSKHITIGKLHEVYKIVCQKRNLLAVDQAEFVGLCSLIETHGIIRVTGKKEPRMHKVTLEWDEEEVSAALKDKQLMSSILQDDKCLGRF